MAAKQQKPTPPQKPVPPAAKTPEVRKPAAPAKPAEARKPEARTAVLPLSRINYILLAACVAVIALGFYLMSLDPFIDATQFSISLYIAPPVVMAGFVGVIFAIMYRPKATAAPASGDPA
ncbi:MAG: DUF3098 domain-containing protein [Bacteroidia bacterium]|nr:DUF3098 domain-containing protein [Bacteroidia bacterium]